MDLPLMTFHGTQVSIYPRTPGTTGLIVTAIVQATRLIDHLSPLEQGKFAQ